MNRLKVILSIRLAVPVPLAYASFALLSRPIIRIEAFLKAVRSTFICFQAIGVAGFEGSNGGRYVGPTCVPFSVTRKLVLALAILKSCFRSKVIHIESG